MSQILANNTRRVLYLEIFIPFDCPDKAKEPRVSYYFTYNLKREEVNSRLF